MLRSYASLVLTHFAMALTPFTAEPVMASVNLRLEPAHTGLWVAQDDGDDFLGELEDTESVGGAETGQIEAGEEDETEMAPREDLGGATGFVFKRGFYTASDLGAFLRFGGYTYDEQTSCLRCKARTNSDLAPYIGLAVGYDMTEWLGLQLSFGSGYVAGAAPVQGTNQAHLDSTYPLDHAITMINAAAVFLGTYGTVWPLKVSCLEGWHFCHRLRCKMSMDWLLMAGLALVFNTRRFLRT